MRNRPVKRAHPEDEAEYATRRKQQILAYESGFLKLPGEIRNHIYTFLLDETDRIVIARKEKRIQRRRYENNPPLEPTTIHLHQITQICRQIRSETHLWWMSKHEVAIKDVDDYINCFLFDHVERSHKFNPLKDKKGSLKLNIDLDGWGDEKFANNSVDILQLLKFKAKCPEYSINFADPTDVDLKRYFQGGRQYMITWASGLTNLLENQNVKWRQWVESGVVTQIRVIGRPRGCNVRVVVKSKWFENWMKSTIPTSKKEDLATLGLDLEYLSVLFGLCD